MIIVIRRCGRVDRRDRQRGRRRHLGLAQCLDELAAQVGDVHERVSAVSKCLGYPALTAESWRSGSFCRYQCAAKPAAAKQHICTPLADLGVQCRLNVGRTTAAIRPTLAAAVPTPSLSNGNHMLTVATSSCPNGNHMSTVATSCASLGNIGATNGNPDGEYPMWAPEGTGCNGGG